MIDFFRKFTALCQAGIIMLATTALGAASVFVI